MKKLLLTTIIYALFLSLNAHQTVSKPKSGREKLGARIGYVHSASDIKNEFGHGSVILMHITERIKPPLFVDLNFGALYLGKSATDDITQSIFGPGVTDANMRVLFISLSPTLEFSVSEQSILYFSAGLGFYSISVLLEMGLFGSDISDEHLGANTGTGLYWSISDNWKLDFNFSLHHVWTAEDRFDIFYLYSRGDSDPNFYQFTVGACVGLN